MAHVEVIVTQKIMPPPDTQAVSADVGTMTATIQYVPPDNATPSQIGNQVERIVKRLAKLADD